MSNPQNPDPLAHLADDLSAEYGQARQADQQRAVAELKAVIERVPEQSEFTESKRFKILAPLFAVISVVLLGVAINSGKTGAIIFTALMVLLFIVTAWQHRNAGSHAFMRLTRRQLLVDTLDAPVDLLDVTEVLVKDEGIVTLQRFTLRPGAPLPKHRHCGRLMGAQGMALAKPFAQVRIHSPGLMRDGRKLNIDEIAGIIDDYRMAAHAQQQLDAMPQG